MSRIFITGDTHGNIDLQKLKEFPLKDELTKDDYMIIAGDFGGLWSGSKDGIKYGYKYPDKLEIDTTHDEEILNFYNKQNYTTLFIDGNHENFKLLNSYPVEEWNGGKIHKISDSIYHLMRGEVFNINNLKILTIGGAESIDKNRRVKDFTWWEEELPTEEELKVISKNIRKHDCKFDYVITHCCADRFHKYLDLLFDRTDILTDYFDYIEDKIEYTNWFFGHYHTDKKIDDKHLALYDDIIEIF